MHGLIGVGRLWRHLAMLIVTVMAATALSSIPVAPAKAQSADQERVLSVFSRIMPPQTTWSTPVARIPLVSYGLQRVLADGTNVPATSWAEGAKVLVLLGPDCPMCLANLRTAVTDFQSGTSRASFAVILMPGVEADTITLLTSRGYTVIRPSAYFLETLVLMAGFDLPVRAIREQIASAIDSGKTEIADRLQTTGLWNGVLYAREWALSHDPLRFFPRF